MNGSSLFLSKEAGEEGGPDTASVFLVGYGFTEGGDSFRMKTTYFSLELTEEGDLTVIRDAQPKLVVDVTVPYPIVGYGNLNKTRQVLRDIGNYITNVHDISNRKPSNLLLVNRPHGDGHICDLRLGSIMDGSFFNAMWQMSPDHFNERTLEQLYESYGSYKVKK
jgi:hypothetical protein